MTIWTLTKADLKRPYYQSLADSVVNAIDSGSLKKGDQLPTHRQLADELELSVQTVSRAFEELIRLGFVKGEVGRGSYIAASNKEARTPFLSDSQYDSVIECSILKPVSEDIHHDIMQSALRSLADDLPRSAIFSFRPNVATERYLGPATKWLARCGIETSPDTVHVTNGNTSAMTIALLSATNPGELVVTEEIGHHTLKPLTQYLGRRLTGIEIDEQGVVPEVLDSYCKKTVVKALYVMPGGAGPTASVMSVERRNKLVEVARKHDITIIENDAMGPLQPDREAPVYAMAPERTLYFTSFTKCIMPGLRTGYLVAPKALSQTVANRHLVTNWMATPIMAEIASRWVDDGTAETLLKWQRHALSERYKIATGILPDCFKATPYGMHLWLTLSNSWTEDSFLRQCQLQGVAVAPGSTFNLSDQPQAAAVRVCTGSVPTEQLRQGLQTVNRVLHSNPKTVAATQ